MRHLGLALMIVGAACCAEPPGDNGDASSERGDAAAQATPADATMVPLQAEDLSRPPMASGVIVAGAGDISLPAVGV